MANLVALYTAWKGSGICPATLDILIIVPAPCCFMTGITASMDSTAPKKLVSIVSRQQDHSGTVVRDNSGKRFADSHGSAGHYDNLAGHVDFFAHAELLSSLHWPVSRWRKMKNTSVTLGSHEHTPASIPA